jgi:peptide/nickel transport system substrate-binding protein
MISGISTFLLLMMIIVSVFNLQVRVGSGEATPPYGGTLRIGESRTKPSTLNPLIDKYNCYRSLPMFDSLLTYDENCSLQPELAESYETSEDGLNVTFHLYENVSWHDEVQFNASDVKFTFDTIRDDPNVVSDYKDFVLSYIDSTEVIDAFTVVFHLNEPLAAILHYLSYIPIIPRHIYEGTDLTTNPANQNPIGTGPFKFESWTPQTNLTVTAYEQYFRGRPYLDSLFYRWDFNQSTQLTVALENNIFDMLGGGLTSGGDVDLSEIQVLQDTTGNSVAVKEAAEYWSIFLNMGNPILQNRNVRQAIAHAINKTKIVREAFYGYASIAKEMVPPSIREWYNPDVTDYELNKTLAEQLLDYEYPRAPDGWRFSLVIKALPRILLYPWEENALNIMRDDLISVGVNASIEVVPISHYTSRNYDAFFLGWIFGVIGPDDLYDVFHSEHGMAYLQNYCNSTLDALLEEGRSSFNETLRKIDFDLAQEIIAQDIPQIFIYHPSVIVACNNDFHGRFLSTPPINGRLTPYFLANIWYDPTLCGEGNCPFRVCFTDSEGRRTGYYDGAAYEDIPNSTYSGMDSDPQLVKIRTPAGVYTVELFGTENGPYKFEFANIALDYKDVWIPEGFIYGNQTISFTVQVNEDGSIDRYWHNHGIPGMTASKTVVGRGFTMNLSVSVFNWGNFTETFNVTVSADAIIIETREVTLTGGSSTTLTPMWNTSGLAYGNYTLIAAADTVPGETDISDNTFAGSWVVITILGDNNGDIKVGPADFAYLSAAYGSTPGAPNWNPNCDVNGDGKVGPADFAQLSAHYGQHYP